MTISGRPVRHSLLSAPELYQLHFAAAFALRRWYGLGWLWPRRFSGRLPPIARRWLGRFDAAAGRFPPCRGWGRFYVLDLERRPDGPPATAPGWKAGARGPSGTLDGSGLPQHDEAAAVGEQDDQVHHHQHQVIVPA